MLHVLPHPLIWVEFRRVGRQKEEFETFDLVHEGPRLRARIVSEPVAEYIAFEYDITFSNVLAGEQVRWLPRRKAAPLALPGADFWLLDGERVMFNHFDGNGDWVGVEWTKDPAIARLCGSSFEAVWELATPHEEYRTA